MGSRITRAIYHNERNARIPPSRQPELNQLVFYSLSFLTVLLFFFQGYLFSNFREKPWGFTGWFAAGALVTFMSFVAVEKGALAGGAAAVFVTIVETVIGVKFGYVQTALMIFITTLIALLTQTYAKTPLINSLLAFLQFQAFTFGIIISNSIKILVQESNPKSPVQESPLLKLTFQIAVILIMVLIIGGRKFLQRHIAPISLVPYVHQIVHVGFGFALIFMGYTLKRSYETSALWKLVYIGSTLAVVALLQLFQVKKWWILIITMAVVTKLLEIATQSQQSVVMWTIIVKDIGINLIILESISKWSKCFSTQHLKPYLIVFVSFFAFLLSYLLGISVNHFFNDSLFWMIATVYLCLIGYHHKIARIENYLQLPD